MKISLLLRTIVESPQLKHYIKEHKLRLNVPAKSVYGLR